jgi:hypothetical protein
MAINGAGRDQRCSSFASRGACGAIVVPLSTAFSLDSIAVYTTISIHMEHILSFLFTLFLNRIKDTGNILTIVAAGCHISYSGSWQCRADASLGA